MKNMKFFIFAPRIIVEKNGILRMKNMVCVNKFFYVEKFSDYLLEFFHSKYSLCLRPFLFVSKVVWCFTSMFMIWMVQ